MVTDDRVRLLSRQVRAIHYLAPAIVLLIFGALAHEFGLAISIRFLRAVLLAVSTSIGVYAIKVAANAFRTGRFRGGTRFVERDKQPSLFWIATTCTALLGPLLIGACLALTYWW